MLKLNVPLKHCTGQVEAETQTGLFAEWAAFHEVFGEKRCGLCQTEDIRPAVRAVTQGKKTFTYHEFQCLNPQCRARLSLGVHLESGNTLFPHRKLDPSGRPSLTKGEYGEHRGWTTYKGEPKPE